MKKNWTHYERTNWLDGNGSIVARWLEAAIGSLISSAVIGVSMAVIYWSCFIPPVVTWVP